MFPPTSSTSEVTALGSLTECRQKTSKKIEKQLALRRPMSTIIAETTSGRSYHVKRRNVRMGETVQEAPEMAVAAIEDEDKFDAVDKTE